MRVSSPGGHCIGCAAFGSAPPLDAKLTFMLEFDPLRWHHARPALFAFGHDLFGKPVPTFPDHALARLARRRGRVPPRAHVARGLVVAVHHVEGEAIACFGVADAQLARLVALLLGKPEALVPPEA